MRELANQNVRPTLHDGLVKVRSSGTHSLEGHFSVTKTLTMEMSTIESTLMDRLDQISGALETTAGEMYNNVPMINSNIFSNLAKTITNAQFDLRQAGRNYLGLKNVADLTEHIEIEDITKAFDPSAQLRMFSVSSLNLVTQIDNLLDAMSWEMCDEELVDFDVKEELDTIFEQEYHSFQRIDHWMCGSLIPIHV
jgi:hypothetical protein